MTINHQTFLVLVLSCHLLPSEYSSIHSKGSISWLEFFNILHTCHHKTYQVEAWMWKWISPKAYYIHVDKVFDQPQLYARSRIGGLSIPWNTHQKWVPCEGLCYCGNRIHSQRKSLEECQGMRAVRHRRLYRLAKTCHQAIPDPARVWGAELCILPPAGPSIPDFTTLTSMVPFGLPSLWVL